jgi:diguanylate cyclase (GGDEF)-like protein
MLMTNLAAAIIYFIMIAVVILTVLFAYLRDRHKSVTPHLIHLCMITLAWQIFSALSFLISDESLALWLFHARLAFVAFAPVQLLFLSIKFYHIKSSRNLKLIFSFLCIIPTVTAILAVTWPFHTFLRTELYFEQLEPLRVMHSTFGPWFWVHAVYSYILMTASIIYILYQHNKLPKGFRVPSALIATGTAIALFFNIFVVFLASYSISIDLTLVGLSVAIVFGYAGITISDESSLLVNAFDNIFNYLEDCIFILNRKRIIIELNPAARNWLHTLDISIESAYFDELLEKLMVSDEKAPYADYAGERDFQMMVGQQITTYSLRERPIIDQANRQIGAFVILNDVTRYKLLIQHIESDAGIDPITNLGNRRSYEQAISSLDLPSSLPFSVILGDVNGLKFVNDHFGHASGDTLLCTIAQTLRNACPEGVQAYRIGGDEFVILLPGTPPAAAESVVAAIRSALALHNRDSDFRASIALGIATKETEEQNLLECIEQADKNMYLNKQNDRRARR